MKTTTNGLFLSQIKTSPMRTREKRVGSSVTIDSTNVHEGTVAWSSPRLVSLGILKEAPAKSYKKFVHYLYVLTMSTLSRNRPEINSFSGVTIKWCFSFQSNISNDVFVKNMPRSILLISVMYGSLLTFFFVSCEYRF